MDKLGDRFLQRILTPNELQRYLTLSSASAYAFVAKRFAAKEAAVKALGTGIGRGISFQHFEVVNLASGKPELKVDASICARLPASVQWHLSLTDERHYAQAFVILEQQAIEPMTERPAAHQSPEADH